MAAITKAHLLAEVERLEKALNRSEAKHERFKKQVVEVAQQGAEENGWCWEIRRILEDDLKLGRLLPPVFAVEYRRDSEQWVPESTGPANCLLGEKEAVEWFRGTYYYGNDNYRLVKRSYRAKRATVVKVD